MIYVLEELRKIREDMIKNFKHINKSRSPVFQVISLVIGLILIVYGLRHLKMMWGTGCVTVGTISVIVNAVQLYYKKYI